MDMAVDAAGQHELAARIDDLAGSAQRFGQRDDPAVADADIGGERFAGGRDRSRP